MKNVHWTALNNVEGTVWDTSTMGGFGEDFSDVFSDLKDEFKKNKGKGKKKQSTKKKEDNGKSTIVLITDGKRSQNIHIMLGKLTQHGKRSMEQIARSVLHLKASAIGLDGLQALLLNIPTKKEMALLSTWKGDENRLGKVEQYIKALATVPHLINRLQAMIFQLTSPELHRSIMVSTGKIQTACRDLTGSDKFVRLLGIVLEVGNSLNHGTSKGGAKGIQLSSLMKLTQTRTNSGATLLEYIVVHLQNKSPDLLKLSDDLHSIDLATKVALESVRQDVNKMNIGCRQISTGIDLDAKDNCPIFEQAMAPFLAQVQVMRDEAVRTIEQVDVEFAALCSYFAAPPPPTTSPDEFFALVSNFAHTFTTTVTHVDEKNARQKQAALRNNERQKMKIKTKDNRRATTRPKKSNPVKRRQLTGIDKFSVDELKQALPTMATGGMGGGMGGMDQINADVVLKAARRASASMGVFTG